MADLEREGVRVMRECVPREVGRMGSGEEVEEGGRLKVKWYCKNTEETKQVIL